MTEPESHAPINDSSSSKKRVDPKIGTHSIPPIGANTPDLQRSIAPVAATSSTPVSAAASARSKWLRRSDQIFVGSLAITALVVFVIDYARLSGWGARSVEILRLPDTEYKYKLDVNRATWVEWSLLDGIGEILGKRIVADREKNGPFRSVDDVLRVHGIGPKKLERMRPWLEVRDHSGTSERTVSDEEFP